MMIFSTINYHNSYFMIETFNITDRITGTVIQGSSTPVEVIHQVIITLNDCTQCAIVNHVVDKVLYTML